MKKTILATIIVTAIMLTAGCLTKTDKLIDEAYVEDNILHLKFELWDVGYSQDASIYFDGPLNIWLNEKKLDYDWKKYPKEFISEVNSRIITKGRFWYITRYNEDKIYSTGRVVTSGSSDRSSWQRSQLVYIDVLLENTTLKPPIKVELKERKSLFGYEYYKIHDEKIAGVEPS
jgi:hypothetical protein